MGVWVLFTEGGLGVHKDAHKQKKVQVQKKKKKVHGLACKTRHLCTLVNRVRRPLV